MDAEGPQVRITTRQGQSTYGSSVAATLGGAGMPQSVVVHAVSRHADVLRTVFSGPGD